MAPIKRFTRDLGPLAQEFVKKPTLLGREELEALDKSFESIRREPISGREKFCRMMVQLGGMKRRYGHYYAVVEKYTDADNQIEQVAKYRDMKFPFDVRKAWDEWAQQHKPVAAAMRITHHDESTVELPKAAAASVARDQKLRDSYPSEEINPDDIPF